MREACAVPALAALGLRDEAAVYARNIEAILAMGMVNLAWPVSMHQVAGIARACACEWDASEAHFRNGIELAAKLPNRPEEASIRVACADMLRHRDRAGDRERARTLCAEAESMAAKLGLVLIERRARDLGNSP